MKSTIPSIALGLSVLFFTSPVRADMASDLERVIMVQETNAAAIRYNIILDTRDPADLAKAFSEDAVLELGALGQHRGRDAIRAYIVKYGSAQFPGRKHRHFLTNFVVEATGKDTAKGSAYVADYYYDATNTNLPFFPVTLIGSFSYEFKRTDSGWRISRVVLERDRAAVESPLQSLRQDAPSAPPR
jgi:hypothetical protein